MSRTTRERRRSTPVSVRFADELALVQVIGPMEPVRRVGCTQDNIDETSLLTFNQFKVFKGLKGGHLNSFSLYF